MRRRRRGYAVAGNAFFIGGVNSVFSMNLDSVALSQVVIASEAPATSNPCIFAKDHGLLRSLRSSQ